MIDIPETMEAPRVQDIKQPLADALTDIETATAKTAQASESQGTIYSLGPRTAQEAWYKNMLSISGIPPRYDAASLYRNCDRYEGMPEKVYALELSRKFADSGFLVERSANRFALYLCGSFGVGKTWLATATLKEMIWKRQGAEKGEELTKTNPPIWIKFHALVREVQACYNPAAKTDTLSVIRRFQNAPLLLVDDIGDIEAQGETEDRRRILYEIIDHRNDHMLPTILTSNLDPDMMEAHYGGRSMQRIIELCAFVEMGGDNLREAA